MVLSVGKPPCEVLTLGRGVLIVKNIFDQYEHLLTVIIALPDLRRIGFRSSDSSHGI